MNKSLQSHQGKEKSGFLLLNPASKFENFFLILFFLLLPTQLGKHFWPDFAYVSGIRIDYLSPTLYSTDVILLFLFGTFLFRYLSHKFAVSTKSLGQVKKSLETHSSRRHFFFIVVVLLSIIANTVFSQNPLVSVYGWTKFFELLFLTFYLVYAIHYRFQLQWIAFLFAISSFFESLLAIAQYLNQGSLNGIFYFFGERFFTGSTPGIANASIGGTLILRPYATFPHPNVLAAYLLVSMVLVWSFLLKSKKRWLQLFAILSFLASSIALLLTFSRVCILIWIVLLVFIYSRLFFRQVKSLTTRISILIGIIIIFVIIALLPLTQDIFLRFAQTSLSEESITERAELWSVSWKMIQQHPLFGVGLNNFIPALAPLQKPLPLGLYLQPVHLIFVLIMAEMGVIGFCLFVWLFVATVFRIAKQKSPTSNALIRNASRNDASVSHSEAGGEIKGALFVLLGIIFVTGLLDHYWLTLQQGQLLFATIFGLCWAKLQKT